MRKKRYDNANKGYIIRMVFEITLLALLILMSVAGAALLADISNSTSNNVSNSNKYDEAIKTLDKALEINPQDSNAWLYKGNVLSDLNKSDEAIKAYDKAIGINPQNSIAWNNKGNALNKLNATDEAIKAYDKAIEIN